jgi:peptidoglycan hydrolase CwlO-like protein
MSIVSQKFLRVYIMLSLILIIGLSAIVFIMWRTQAKIHNNVLYVSQQVENLSNDSNSSLNSLNSDVNDIKSSVDSIENALSPGPRVINPNL